MRQLTREEKQRLILLLREKKRREGQKQFYHLFPDETVKTPGGLFYARDLYPRHLEHFAAGATYRERCFMAANRVGKTVTGGYEVAAHATGEYPHWWEGRLFMKPTKTWIAGTTVETTRDILQTKLFGDVVAYNGRRSFSGTGIVPGHLIGSVTWRKGGDLFDKVKIRHVPTGGWSTIQSKTYEQGRKSFEGVEQDIILLDEEPPLDVYNECLIRTATTDGIVILTFTPLGGKSEVVMSFDLEPEIADVE